MEINTKPFYQLEKEMGLLKLIQREKEQGDVTTRLKNFCMDDMSVYTVVGKDSGENGTLFAMEESFRECSILAESRNSVPVYCTFKLKYSSDKRIVLRFYYFKQAYKEIKKENEDVINELFDDYVPHVVNLISDYVM